MHRLKSLLRKKSSKPVATPPESTDSTGAAAAAADEDETQHQHQHQHHQHPHAKTHAACFDTASPLRVSVPVSTPADDDVSPATPADSTATPTGSASTATTSPAPSEGAKTPCCAPVPAVGAAAAAAATSPHARPPSPSPVVAAAGVVEPRGRQRSGAFYDAAPPIIAADGTVRLATPPLPRPATALRVTTGAARLPDGVSWSLRFAVGVADTVGRRAAMEDAHAVLGRFGGVPMRDLFLVCDGHNGAAAARAVCTMLPDALLARLDTAGAGASDINAGTRDTAGANDSDTNADAGAGKEEEALRAAFADVDARLRAEDVAGGTTATAVLVDVDAAWVASVGDTRAVLVQRGTLARLTTDHRPADAAEAAAVVARGGTVTAVGRELRVNGTLAITRALGDRELAGAISAVPDVRRFVFDFEPDSALVVACDGLWDVVSDKDVVDTISNVKDPLAAAEELRGLAFKNGSTDNITVLVIRAAS